MTPDILALLQVVGPTSVIALIFWIRSLSNENKSILGKLDSVLRENKLHDEKAQNKLDVVAAEHSRQHQDMGKQLVDIKDTVMERVEKIMTDHSAHAIQEAEMKTMIVELVDKARSCKCKGK